MGRAPCCEKLRVKSGPWTPEEDNILVAHIQRFGHGNWRALPKQAGLSRCGKSCRLRWVNYLRPDIKRGNFTREEEDAVIQLHQLLGNRWSAIAARLPGRTDNEIKNVWHTHLKKRLVQKGATQVHKTNAARHRSVEGRRTALVSLEQSFSSSATEYSMASSRENVDAGSTPYGAKEGTLTSEELQIDDSFWSETLPMTIDSSASVQTGDHFGANGSSSSATTAADEMDFWLRVFMQAGDMQDLMQI